METSDICMVLENVYPIVFHKSLGKNKSASTSKSRSVWRPAFRLTKLWQQIANSIFGSCGSSRTIIWSHATFRDGTTFQAYRKMMSQIHSFMGLAFPTSHHLGTMECAGMHSHFPDSPPLGTTECDGTHGHQPFSHTLLLTRELKGQHLILNTTCWLALLW